MDLGQKAILCIVSLNGSVFISDKDKPEEITHYNNDFKNHSLYGS